MVKQKVVMKLSLQDAKQRSKALKTTVGLPGVISVTVDGDRIIVVGEGVDSVALTTVLRKKMGYVELVSVGAAGAEEKRDDKKKSTGTSTSAESMSWHPAVSSGQCHVPQQVPYVYHIHEPNHHDNCSIM